MDVELIAQVVIAVLGLFGALAPLTLGANRRKSLRADLRSDIEAFGAIPDGAVKQRLEAHILAALTEIEEDREKRRDPAGITLGIMFIVGSAFAGVWSLSAGGWWLLALVPAGLGLILGSVGFAQDASRRKRDVKGKPVKRDTELPPGGAAQEDN